MSRCSRTRCNGTAWHCPRTDTRDKRQHFGHGSLAFQDKNIILTTKTPLFFVIIISAQFFILRSAYISPLCLVQSGQAHIVSRITAAEFHCGTDISGHALPVLHPDLLHIVLTLFRHIRRIREFLFDLRHILPGSYRIIFRPRCDKISSDSPD